MRALSIRLDGVWTGGRGRADLAGRQGYGYRIGNSIEYPLGVSPQFQKMIAPARAIFAQGVGTNRGDLGGANG